MKAIRYTGGYKYQLVEDYTVETGMRPPVTVDTRYIFLSRSGRLSISQGYAWDGPSGPAIDTKNFMRGSLVHDALYQLIRQGYLMREHRGEADMVLRKLCREDGMCAIRTWWVYWSVRVFGFLAARKPKEIQVAP